MPQIHNNILCITHEEITSVVSVANYKWLVHAKSINPIRRGCYGTPALIEYVSLPTRIKEAYVSKYGDPTDKSKNYTLKGLISIDYKAEDFYARHELADGRKLKPEYQREYTINASVLRAIGHLLNDRSALRKALGGSTTKLFSKIVEATNAIKDEYKHTLPDCDKRLKDKLKEFQKKF